MPLWGFIFGISCFLPFGPSDRAGAMASTLAVRIY